MFVRGPSENISDRFLLDWLLNRRVTFLPLDINTHCYAIDHEIDREIKNENHLKDNWILNSIGCHGDTIFMVMVRQRQANLNSV